MNAFAVRYLRPQRRQRRPGGFTLIEMTLAAAITSLVMAGLFSAMLIAARVAESPYKTSALDLHYVLDRLRDDASVATAVTQLTSSSLTLTLADRNSDGQPETVTYDWTKAAQAKGIITRTYNGVAENIAVIAPGFSIASTIDISTSTTPVESSEQLLFSRTPALPFTYAIKSGQWTGQFIIPSLPSNATSWRVTRVRFPARYKGPTNGTTRVQIRSQVNGTPKTVIDEATMLESSLPAAFAKQEVSFTKATDLSVDGACLILQWGSDADACEVQYESLLSLLASGNRVTSTNSGLTWSGNTLQSLSCEIYGTYTTPGGSTSRRKLRALTLQMKSDAALSASLTTTIRFANLPEVAG